MKQPEYYYDLARRKTSWETGDLKSAVDFISAHGGSILDVGCGQSKLSKYITSERSYTGLDPSPEALPTVVGVAEHMPFPDGTFDVVFSSHALQMFADPKKCLEESIRVTKPRGYMIIIAPNLERPWATIPATRHFSRRQNIVLLIRRFLASLRRLFGGIPFLTLSQNYVQATGTFEHGDDDLIYITSAYEVARLFKSHSFGIIRRNPYLSGGIFFIFQKP